MNSQHFGAGESAYNSGDYVGALKSYYATLKEDAASFAAGDSGLVYYRIGNCLLKMRTFNEAAISYEKALEDSGFNARAVAKVNLGKAQLGMGRFEEAVQSFNEALLDPAYAKPYQAQMGLGNAYTKLGMIVDAGTAYRNAALDERNPSPTKALMNLGSCFMVLGRPEDAIESYNAVFEFDPSQTVAQKTYESLGQAFTAAGHHHEAIDAFGRALAPGGFTLSQAAQADYQQSQMALGMGSAAQPDPFAGINTFATATTTPDFEPGLSGDGAFSYGAGNVPTAEDTGFFDATESELVQLSKRQLKRQKKLRHTGLKIMLAFIILLIVSVAGVAYAYVQGYGWPTQESVIADFFEAHNQNTDVTQYWVGNAGDVHDGVTREEAIASHMLTVPAKTSSVEIVFLERGMTTTSAVVVAHLPEGGSLRYELELARSGIGWKISMLELVFPSQQ